MLTRLSSTGKMLIAEFGAEGGCMFPGVATSRLKSESACEITLLAPGLVKMELSSWTYPR